MSAAAPGRQPHAESWVIALGLALTAGAAGLYLLTRQAGAAPGLRGVGLVPLALGLVGVIALSVGLVGYVVVPPLRRDAREAGFGSHRVILATIAVAILASSVIPLALLLLLLPGRPKLGTLTLPGFLIATVSTDVALLGLAYVRAVRPGLLGLAALGWGRISAERLASAGLLGGVALFGLSAATQLLLRPFGIHQDQLDSFLWIRGLPPAEFAVIVVAGAVAAPIAEELFFRGFVYQSYARRYPPLVAAVLSAVLFALLHVNLAAFLPIFVMGLFLAWLFQRTGSLVPGMVAHGLNNAIAFTLLYLVGM